MKNKLFKRLITMVAAVAMVATMVTGFSKEVKAAYTPTTPAEVNLINLVQANEENLKMEFQGAQYTLKYVVFENVSFSVFLNNATDPALGNNEVSFSNNTWTITDRTPDHNKTILVTYIDADNYIEKFTCTFPDGDIYTFLNTDPKPDPTPVPSEPEKEVEKIAPADTDTFKSEAPYGTAGVTNTNSKIGDLKVHKIDAKTEINQKALADAFASKYGKKARILVSTSVYPRRELGADAGKKEAIKWANLEKNPQAVYAVCYNQTDKAYYLAGNLDKNGIATLQNFVLRPATNITIFTLE